MLDRPAPRLADVGGERLSGLDLLGIRGEVELVEADLRDAAAVAAAVAGAESVFHLAAQTIVGVARESPLETFEVNVQGAWNVFEACRAHGVARVVFASSDKAYGSSPELPYREDFPLRGINIYDAGKAAADTIARSYANAYGLPLAVTRFANVYGGGDLNFSRLIPETVVAVLDGRAPVIRSDGSPERDFLHVDDAVSAYLAISAALDSGAAGEAFNAGGERPHSVREVVESIAAAAGGGVEPDFQGARQPRRRDRPPVRRLLQAARADRLAPRGRAGGRPAADARVVPRAFRGAAGEAGRLAMCGRFTVTAKDTKTVADRFQVELERSLERSKGGLERFNVAPTQEVLTVRSSPEPEEAAQGEREARLMRWGLVPRWAKDLKVGYRMINAKAENLDSSRAYAPLVGKFRHRCLILADGFYEWMKAEDPKQPRQPWRFTVDGGELFAFAGLCTRKEWQDEEDRGAADGWLYSCTIVTTTPNEVVAPVHDRMPAILPSAEAEAAWLRPDLSAADAIAMCGPLPAERMRGAPANPKLNKVGKGDRGAGAARRALRLSLLRARLGPQRPAGVRVDRRAASTTAPA